MSPRQVARIVADIGGCVVGSSYQLGAERSYRRSRARPPRGQCSRASQSRRRARRSSKKCGARRPHGEGQYKILDLGRGFTPSRSPAARVQDGREGQVGTERRRHVEHHRRDAVCAVEETVTVSGQTAARRHPEPCKQHRVTSQDVIQGLPRARTMQGFTLFVPGVKTGSALQGGQPGRRRQRRRVVPCGHHPPVAARTTARCCYDGMRTNNLRFSGAGTYTAWQPNGGAVQEVVTAPAAIPDEAAVSGPRPNPIPKDGGKHAAFMAFGTTRASPSRANNIDAALVAQGVASQTAFDKIYELNPTLGGPLMKDKLWFFFGDFRYWINNVFAPGAFSNISPSPIA